MIVACGRSAICRKRISDEVGEVMEEELEDDMMIATTETAGDYRRLSSTMFELNNANEKPM